MVFGKLNKSLFYTITVVCIAGFAAFVWWFQHYTLARETHRIQNHARVIASSLWTYEEATPTAYLVLAAQSNGYPHLKITDSQGVQFLAFNAFIPTRLDRFFSAANLMPVYTIETPILYEDRTIGTLSVEWMCRNIYLYFYILLFLLLFLFILRLFLTIGHLNKTLERRVRDRTEALEKEIAERRQAEQHLADSRENLKVAMDIAKLGHWEYDTAEDSFQFDDQFYDMYATTAEEQGGYTMSSAQYAKRFLPEEEQSLVGIAVQEALMTEDPGFSKQIEHRIIRGDGQERYMAVRFRVIKDIRVANLFDQSFQYF